LETIINEFGGGTLNFSFLSEYYPYFITGTISTVVLAFFTVIMGVIIGTFIALMKLSNFKILNIKIFNILSSTYIEVIRGTPMMVQVLIIYFAFPNILPQTDFNGIDISRVVPGIIALSINSGAYVAEIIRAGIQAVDRGQMEAARSLGLTHIMSMRYIILPQAVKNILPALGNEFVVIIKESSIVSIIGLSELTKNARDVGGATYITLEPMYIAAVIYFILTFSMSKFLGRVERRLRTDDRG
jgi:His/Glu/Gln/Arg/opine family amino acid ABC transporter permease subunit